MIGERFNTPLTGETKDEWLTPPPLIKALGAFDLDPCAPIVRPWPMAVKHFTREDDGLVKPWHGRVWLNPPYGRDTFKWLARLSEHRFGVALTFARTETKGFHEHVWAKAVSVFFFAGRLSFFHVDGTKGGTANAPSCLVVYSMSDRRALESSGLKGKLVNLREARWSDPPDGL